MKPDNNTPQINEINMSPSALAAFAKTADSYNVRAGFEAELIFSEIDAGTGVDSEPDYDADEEISLKATLDDFKEFFRETLGSRSQRWDQIEEDYLNAVGEKAYDYTQENFNERAREFVLQDRSEEQRIRDDLEAGDYTDEEIDNIIIAGKNAPEFDTSKEQRAYMDEVPDYKKWVAAQTTVNREIDREIEESREDIEQELNDEYWSENDYYMGAWLRENRIRKMSQFADQYEIDWPHWTGGESSEAFDTYAMENAAEELAKLVGTKVKVSSEYHDAERDASSYIIEPDSSIETGDSDHARAEIVSPPMPLSQATDQLQKVFRWARTYGGYTNRSTGLHVGVSLPDMEKVDYVKLALLLGDEYVLKTFGRQLNVYCQSVFQKISTNRNPQTIAQAVDALKKGMTGVAANALKYTVFRSTGTTEKYVSINWKTKYIEFRSMGGDYIDNVDKIITTMHRYVRALVSAAEPELDKKEYLTKLYKLVQTANNDLKQFDAIEPVNMIITKYMAGEVSKETILNYKKYFQQAAAARKSSGSGDLPHPAGDLKRWRVASSRSGDAEIVMARSEKEALARAKMQNTRFNNNDQYSIVQVDANGIPLVLPNWATAPLR